MVDIYELIDPVTGDVKYIGRSTNFASRFNGHMSQAVRRRRGAKEEWIASHREQGRTPSFNILESVSHREAPFVEQKWITKRRSEGCDLLNACNAVAPSAGRRGNKDHDAVGQLPLGAVWHRGQKDRWEKMNDNCEEFRHREDALAASGNAAVMLVGFQRQQADGSMGPIFKPDQDAWYNKQYAQMCAHWAKGEELVIARIWQCVRALVVNVSGGFVRADFGWPKGQPTLKDRPARWRGKPWTYEEQDAMWDCEHPENLRHCRPWQLRPYLEEVVV